MGIATFILIMVSMMLVGTIYQLLFLDKVENYFELLILSFPIGLGFSIIFILITSTFLDISKAFIIFNLISLVVAVIVKKKLFSYLSQIYLRIPKCLTIKAIKFVQKRKISGIFILIILFIIGIVVYKNATWPITDWDAISNYDFLARVWYQANSINPFKKGIIIVNPGLIWPKFVSIMHIFAYWAFGLGYQGKIINSLLFIIYIFIIFVNFKEKYSFTTTLFFTLLTLTTPLWEQSMMAYTNFPFSVFLITSLIYLTKYIRGNCSKRYYLFVGLAMLLISMWIRESFYIFHLFTALVFGIFSIKEKKIRVLPIILITIVFGSMWLWDRIEVYHLSQINQSVYKQFFPEKGERLYLPMPSYGEILTTPKYFNFSRFWQVVPFAFSIYKQGVGIYIIIYIMFLVYITKFGTRLIELLNPKNLISLWLLVFFSLFFIGLYIESIRLYRYWYMIAGSAIRMISFIPPLVLFVVLKDQDVYAFSRRMIDKLWKKIKF